MQYLRSLDDCKTIRQRAQGVKRAVVIGGGFIAMEVAAVLAQKGIEMAMVLREDRIWKQFFSPPMSLFFEAYYRRAASGYSRLATDQRVAGRGESGISSSRGWPVDRRRSRRRWYRRPACDRGVLANGAGIEVAEGVIVNEYLETERLPGVPAAGDIANYSGYFVPEAETGRTLGQCVVFSQGQYCARVLMGERTPFKHVPYFFSDVFDLSYEFWGDPAGAEETIHRGDLASNSFSVWWLRKTTVVAAFVMNRPDEERDVAPKWIESKQAVSAERLADASYSVLEASEISR